MDYTKIKTAIDFLKKSPTAQQWLDYSQGLDEDELKITIALTKTKPFLGEYELPSKLYEKQGVDKLVAMIDAWRSDEYRGFILHLFNSYILDKSNVCYASTLGNPDKTDNCAITGIAVCGLEKWNIDFANKNSEESFNKNMIAIINPKRSSTILSKVGYKLLADLYNLLYQLKIDINAKN